MAILIMMLMPILAKSSSIDWRLQNETRISVAPQKEGFKEDAKPATVAFKDASPKKKTTVAACRAKFPELLERADRELAPWKVISPDMIDRTWKCSNVAGQAVFYGIHVKIHEGKVSYSISGVGGMPNLRAQGIVRSINYAASKIQLADATFSMSTADHLYQSVGDRPYNGSYNPYLAPILVPYRLQRDTGSVAAPDWTFFRGEIRGSSKNTFSEEDDLDFITATIKKSATELPFEDRISKLFFMGDANSGVRERAWQLSIHAAGNDTERWGAIGMGPPSHHRTDRLDGKYKWVSHADHCKYKYLLSLSGNANSNRYKYLFFCNATVVAPVRNGGNGGAGDGNEFEEFWHHRAIHGKTVLRPRSIEDLPQVVQELRASGARAQVEEARVLFIKFLC